MSELQNVNAKLCGEPPEYTFRISILFDFNFFKSNFILLDLVISGSWLEGIQKSQIYDIFINKFVTNVKITYDNLKITYRNAHDADYYI